ncbi:hypothetical protein K8I61_15660 [bacterium]|nr:hypothetical protein [bacterium]
MNRTEFETLRDLPGKAIIEDIQLRFVRPSIREHRGIRIRLPISPDLLMNISVNERTAKKVVNIVSRGTGPNCRLCVDGSIHGIAGRSHKHALQSEACPAKNLPYLNRRDDLSGRNIRDIFDEMCHLGLINFRGNFILP